MTQDFLAFSTTPPAAREALERGAQKWLRDPASLKARVVRCLPRAMSASAASRTGLRVVLAPATTTSLAQTCIMYTIATDGSASARMALTSAKARGPRPEPPKLVGTLSASSPASPSAAMAAAGKLPALSSSCAAGEIVASAISLVRATALP